MADDQDISSGVTSDVSSGVAPDVPFGVSSEVASGMPSGVPTGVPPGSSASVPAEIPWPNITDDNLDALYKLFCEALEPIGDKKRAEEMYGQLATIIVQPRWVRFGGGDPSALNGIYRMEDMLATIKWGFKDAVEELTKAAAEDIRAARGELDRQFEDVPPRPGEVASFRVSAVFVERTNLDESEWVGFPDVVSYASQGTFSPVRKIKLVALPDHKEGYRTIGELLGLDDNPAILCFSEYAPVSGALWELLNDSVPDVPSPPESSASSAESSPGSQQATTSLAAQAGNSGAGARDSSGSDSDETVKSDRTIKAGGPAGVPQEHGSLERADPEADDMLFMAPLTRQDSRSG